MCKLDVNWTGERVRKKHEKAMLDYGSLPALLESCEKIPDSGLLGKVLSSDVKAETVCAGMRGI